MAIKEVKKIPEIEKHINAAPFEYVIKLEADIRYAYVNHIKRFEFVGYANPNYLAESARQAAHRFIDEILYIPARSEVREILMTEFPDRDYITIGPKITASNNKAIKVYGRTVDDEKRVFVEIDYDYIANFKQELLEKLRVKFS